MKLLIALSLFSAVCYARTGFGPGEQDWGYVTVREGAHMFWWLYYTTADVKNYTERPLIIWLQGGPGGSSTGFGNFGELGPLDMDQQPRNFTWVKDANVLFLDNPVGTGFSYTERNSQLTVTNTQIAEDLVAMMKEFYEKFPEFKQVPLYVLAESYGGKMAVEFALLLDKEINEKKIESNLIGIGLGDSWISPIDSVLTWAPFLLHMGAVDQSGYDKINKAALKTKELLDSGKFEEATEQWGATEWVIMDVAYGVDFYNVLTPIESYWAKNLQGNGYDKFVKPEARVDEVKLDRLMNGPVKEALKVDRRWGAQRGAVFDYLAEDFMKPVVHIVEDVLNNTDIKVAVFTGQLDLIVDTPGTVLWVDNMNWTESKKWKNAERRGIHYDGIYEGYEKGVGNFGLFWVNRAGHMVPSDNPNGMDYILRRLTKDYDGSIRRKSMK